LICDKIAADAKERASCCEAADTIHHREIKRERRLIQKHFTELGESLLREHPCNEMLGRSERYYHALGLARAAACEKNVKWLVALHPSGGTAHLRRGELQNIFWGKDQCAREVSKILSMRCCGTRIKWHVRPAAI
jgi:carbonic anhydrase